MSANVLAKIVDFQSLTPGWCYGEGFPFDERLLNKAIELATSLLGQGFEQLDAFPGLNGEVRVTAYQRSPRGNRYYLEFTLEPSDHVITFLCEADGAEEVYREGLSFAECQLLIKNYGRRLCNSYGLSIPGTSTENWRVSRVWPAGFRGARLTGCCWKRLRRPGCHGGDAGQCGRLCGCSVGRSLASGVG